MPKPSIAPDAEVIERDDLVPLYRVVLLDDNDHTYDYVIEMLQKIFIFTLEEAYRHAEEVDRCRPHGADHLRAGAGGIRARPDPRLRPGLAAAALQGIHVGGDRAGGVRKTGVGGRGPGSSRCTDGSVL